MSCTTHNCGDPKCPVHAHAQRTQQYLDTLFPPATAHDIDPLRPNAKALNGTKPRPSRDPRFIQRRRKAL